ncbi:hypothetical protein DPX16_0471 [Anabarilius grahami]|uniref:Uncharacterized protein n=1 Tax=Anabarilius grahami TaxID=495550 RepID=A0A3N0YVI4_ANAGA|nr:hypothetical protein DPX16_0471 [Anabarilius grahami]
MHDEVSLEVKSDTLICEYGHRLLEKHGSDPSKDGYVSQKMSELGRFVIAAKSLKPKVKNLTDILVPPMFKLAVDAAKKASGYTNSKYRYDRPSLAVKLGHSLKTVGDILIGNYVKPEDEVSCHGSWVHLLALVWLWCVLPVSDCVGVTHLSDCDVLPAMSCSVCYLMCVSTWCLCQFVAGCPGVVCSVFHFLFPGFMDCRLVPASGLDYPWFLIPVAALRHPVHLPLLAIASARLSHCNDCPFGVKLLYSVFCQ